MVLPGVVLPLQRRDQLVKALLTGTTVTPVCSDHNTYVDWRVACSGLIPQSMLGGHKCNYCTYPGETRQAADKPKR